MKKNTITIDLEKLGQQSHYTKWEIKNAQVPERCTLTELLSISDHINIYGLFDDETIYKISGNHDVDQFKSQYLDKEETLEDGIYRYGKGGDLCFVKNGKSYANSWAVENNAPFKRADELINPVKIAEI